MNIRSVEVRNYRSLKNAFVGSLLSFNMLYGYNNTGKSNFLRFIELVFRRKSTTSTVKFAVAEDMQSQVRTESTSWWEGECKDKAFMFTHDKNETPITFAVVMAMPHSELGELEGKLAVDYLSRDHGEAHIRFEGLLRSVTYTDLEMSLTKVELNRKIVYNSATSDTKGSYFPSSRSLAGDQGTLNSFLALFNDCVLCLESDRYLTEEQEMQKGPGVLLPQNIKNWLFEHYMNPQKYLTFDQFVAFMRKYRSEHNAEESAKNAWLQWPLSVGEVGFSRFGQSIELMLRNEKGRFPLSSYGTGVQQIIYLLSRLFFAQAPIVLIEEIELNLSPTAQRELFLNLKRLLEEKLLHQVFFTTHSNYFNFRSDFRILEASLDKEGYTTISRKAAASTAFFKRSLIR